MIDAGRFFYIARIDAELLSNSSNCMNPCISQTRKTTTKKTKCRDITLVAHMLLGSSRGHVLSSVSILHTRRQTIPGVCADHDRSLFELLVWCSLVVDTFLISIRACFSNLGFVFESLLVSSGVLIMHSVRDRMLSIVCG